MKDLPEEHTVKFYEVFAVITDPSAKVTREPAKVVGLSVEEILDSDGKVVHGQLCLCLQQNGGKIFHMPLIDTEYCTFTAVPQISAKHQ